MTRIAVGTDHAGFHLKEAVKAHLLGMGYEVVDFGTDSDQAVDYPDYIRPAAESVSRGECDLGFVCGGSGNGEAITANKLQGIRCCVCWNEWSARLAKEHNNANMISVGARVVSIDEGILIVKQWLTSHFEAGRHQIRIDKIEQAHPSAIPSTPGQCVRSQSIAAT